MHSNLCICLLFLSQPLIILQGNIMYAWARTGQNTPLGLDFKDTPVEGDGFAVGPGTQFEWIALQVHYQQLQKSTGARSGPPHMQHVYTHTRTRTRTRARARAHTSGPSYCH